MVNCCGDIVRIVATVQGTCDFKVRLYKISVQLAIHGLIIKYSDL